MSDKKTSTPKEIPLHEVVLKIMFEQNKERPAELTVPQVHSKIKDEAISEINILEVLTWLVAQKQVECTSGKFYSLDRFELIEQRIRDAKETGKELKLVTEDNPLHEVILSLMFEASKEEPAQLTLDDIYWMVSDPKVHRSLVGDVLNWLLNQGRIESLAGKYTLDRIEFQDQEKVSEKLAAKKKPAKKPKAKKKEAPKEQPKIIIPDSEEEKKPPIKKKEPKPEAKEPVVKKAPAPNPKKVEKVVEKVPAPAPEKVEKVVEQKVQPKAPVNVPVPVSPRWRMPVLIISVICAVYTFYLLFVLNATVSMSVSNDYSGQITQELVAAKSKLSEVSEKGSSNKDDIEFLNEKVQSIEELTQNANGDDENESPNEKISSLLTRLIVALLLTLILVSFLLFSAKNKLVKNKN